MMVRAAVLLLGLVASCRALLAPPTVNISLDADPEVRWMPLTKVFDVDYLKKAAAEVIDTTVPKWVHQAITPVVMALEKYVPQPYAGEIRGMASNMGGSISDVIILNFAYEISAFCTSIIAQDKNGHVYHGRNLDYPHSVLRNLTINVIFLKNGEVAYRGTSFAGYVGLWTGQSPNKFTVSGDQRGSEHWWNWWKNVVSAFLFRRSPVSWLVRETLEEAENFQDAVMRLSKIPIITGVYYIVGGVRAGEGVVITRDRKGPADIWPLNPIIGEWYRVETNFDHWLPPPARDHRRDAANNALNATGQDHIDMETLFQNYCLHNNDECGNPREVQYTSPATGLPTDLTVSVLPFNDCDHAESAEEGLRDTDFLNDTEIIQVSNQVKIDTDGKALRPGTQGLAYKFDAYCADSMPCLSGSTKFPGCV